MSESESDQSRLAGGQPLVVLSDDSERTKGRDAQTANITAAEAVAEAVRTTLGPKGMDKMIVSDSNDIIITNDGSTILDKMDIEHPAADMIVEVAESQETEVGDGTTTATVLAGELLSEADDLLDDDIHPTTIVEGYHEAYEASLDAVDDMVLEEEVDDETLRAVAESSMTGKSIGDITVENLAQSVVEAVRRVESDAGVEREDIHVTAQSGKSSTATEHVEGVVFESEPTSDNMRREADDATVAVVDSPLEQRETEIDAEYSIDSADQLTSAIETEEEELGEYVEALKNADVDVVFVTDDVADYVSSSLAAEGILAFDGVDDEDAEAVSKATGARRVTMVEDIDGDDLGHADSVRAESYDDDVVVVEGGEETQTVTLFVRGGTEHVLDELERAVEDGIDATVAALGGGVVPGAGSVEVAVAEEVRDAAAGIGGRAQIAAEAFADALEVIPRTFATNAGMDPIDALTEIRAENDSNPTGVVVSDGEASIGSPVDEGVLDPADVKREALKGATDAAKMIVRIDDVISSE